MFAGSANLTGGGLTTNAEQYEEIRSSRTSALAEAHRARFEAFWDMGEELSTLRDTGAWEAYKELAADRAQRERGFRIAQRRIAGRMRRRLESGLTADAAEILRKATGLPELVRRGYASRRLDVPRLDWFERTLAGRQVHLRPGMWVRRAWAVDDAERLHGRGRLVPAVRKSIDQLLDVLGEPPLG